MTKKIGSDELQNRITFSNIIGVLLENKKKTYAQYQMIEDIFYDCLCNMDLFEKEKFDIVVNFAAESHVDRSIEDPSIFVKPNVEGTVVLLDAA